MEKGAKIEGWLQNSETENTKKTAAKRTRHGGNAVQSDRYQCVIYYLVVASEQP